MSLDFQRAPPRSYTTTSMANSSMMSSESKQKRGFLTKLLKRRNTSQTDLSSVLSRDEILSDSDDDDSFGDSHSRANEEFSGYSSDIDNTSFSTNEDMRPLEVCPRGGAFLEDLDKLLVEPKYIRVLRRNKHSPKTLGRLFLAQELNSPGDKRNEIFSMKFSPDGKYLATAGRDSVVRVWKVISSPLDRLEFETKGYSHQTVSPTRERGNNSVYAPVFHEKPYRVFSDHTQGVLTLDWSKNNFLVTGSMDRTARLYHVDRPGCLRVFEHQDFVSTVSFLPTDDRFFLSGSLDNTARLWSILDNEVVYSNTTDTLITASAFCPDGLSCVIGGFNGKCFVFETKGMDLHASFEIKRNKHLKSVDTKVTGIQVMNVDDDDNDNEGVVSILQRKYRVLVTTNDSRIRLLDSNTKRLVTRFRGFNNNTSSIMGRMSEDQRYVISGSENHWVYLWGNDNRAIDQRISGLGTKTEDSDDEVSLLGGTKSNKNNLKQKLKNKRLKIFGKEGFATDNKGYSFFHAHHSQVNVALLAPPKTRKLLEMSDDPIYDLMTHGPLLHNKTLASIAANPSICASLNSEKLHELTGKINICDGMNEDEDLSQGMIIVTTDQTGLIRIFRQDSAYYVRKSIIDSNQEIIKKKVIKNGSGSFTDLSAAGGLSKSGSKKNFRSMSPSVYSNGEVHRERSKSFKARTLAESLKRANSGTKSTENTLTSRLTEREVSSPSTKLKNDIQFIKTDASSQVEPVSFQTPVDGLDKEIFADLAREFKVPDEARGRQIESDI